MLTRLSYAVGAPMHSFAGRHGLASTKAFRSHLDDTIRRTRHRLERRTAEAPTSNRRAALNGQPSCRSICLRLRREQIMVSFGCCDTLVPAAMERYFH